MPRLACPHKAARHAQLRQRWQRGQRMGIRHTAFRQKCKALHLVCAAKRSTELPWVQPVKGLTLKLGSCRLVQGGTLITFA